MRARDDTTRYLCAAAHLDPFFAESAVREFLVEPTRAVPPAPGVDAPVVLAESLSAWTRSGIRDRALLVMLLMFALLASWPLIIGWVVAGVVLTMATAAKAATTARRAALQVVWIVIAIVVLVAVAAYSLSDAGAGGRSPVLSVLAFVTGLGMFVVLLCDEVTVWHLLIRRFRRGMETIPMPAIAERQSLQRSAVSFRQQVHRFMQRPPAAAGVSAGNGALAEVPVIVSRGYNLFAGAGVGFESWSVAMPLERRDDAEIMPLTPKRLYDEVDTAFNRLRRQPTLSPSLRFQDLRVGEAVFVAAEELIDHYGDAEVNEFLPNLDLPPIDRLSGTRAHQLRDSALEWARYYLTVQIETWDRDVVVSAFLHFAVDEGTLYLEWSPYLLRPVKKEYRKVDTVLSSAVHPVGKAVLGLLALPGSVPSRLHRAFARPRPTSREVLMPEMYGVQYSLRELAADSQLHNYFQLVDQQRYVKMLESRLLLAVSSVLHSSGYSTATFEARVAPVVNNSVYIGDNSSGNAVSVGSDNKATAAAPTGSGD